VNRIEGSLCSHWGVILRKFLTSWSRRDLGLDPTTTDKLTAWSPQKTRYYLIAVAICTLLLYLLCPPNLLNTCGRRLARVSVNETALRCQRLQRLIIPLYSIHVLSGSVSASIFTSEDGKPDGRWKASTIHAGSISNQDGKHPLVTGFVESVPGKFVGIVLSWRSAQGQFKNTIEEPSLCNIRC